MIHITEKELMQSRIKVIGAISRGVRVRQNKRLLAKIDEALREKRASGVPSIYPEWDSRKHNNENS